MYRWHKGELGGVRGVLGLVESLGTQGQIRYRWHPGALWVPRAVLGACRECRYLGKKGYRWHNGGIGAPRGVGGVRGRGCGGVRSVLGAGRKCRYSGTRRGIGSIRGHLGLLGVSGGIGGYKGASGVSGVHLGWQVDWGPDHIGPQSRIPALPLVPLGECPTSPRPGKGPC